MIRLITLAVALSLFVAVGCESEGSGTTPAGGSVFVDGKPVTAGTVVFYPAAAGRSGSGMIQEDGTFTISYKKMGDGLPPGDYIVTIVADEVAGRQKGETTDEEVGDLQMLDSNAKLKHIVPIKYNSRDTTPLRVSVKNEDKAQKFDFKIDSKS